MLFVTRNSSCSKYRNTPWRKQLNNIRTNHRHNSCTRHRNSTLAKPQNCIWGKPWIFCRRQGTDIVFVLSPEKLAAQSTEVASRQNTKVLKVTQAKCPRKCFPMVDIFPVPFFPPPFLPFFTPTTKPRALKASHTAPSL